jgi:oxygen-dependent protoporphyrinogen oxidase
MPRVTIIGGGISGLSAAWYLAQAGISATLIESRPRLGGVIETECVEGCVIEGGPDSFLSIKPAAMDLVRELGLAGEVIGSNDHLRKTYIWKHGRLVAIPDGLQLMVPTKVLPMLASSLLSWRTKIRMALELLHPPGERPPGDRSVGDFVRAHYGQEAVDYLTEPLLSGIYGGDPNLLSIASILPRFVEMESRHGSLTRGVLSERKAARAQAARLPLFRTLKGGLGRIVQALQAGLNGKLELLSGRAECLERGAGGYRVRLCGSWLETDHLVLACEAHSAAGLLRPLDPRAAELLSTVPYGSSMTVALGFDRDAFPRPLNGFGFLVPKSERRRLIACTWVGTKFPHRVPEGTAVLRCFLGGMGDAGALDLSDDAIVAEVMEELRRIVEVTRRPRFSRIYRWPASMAQYTVGHLERMAELEERRAALPGLHLAGNAYQGIGIPDCIRTGKQAARAVAAAG